MMTLTITTPPEAEALVALAIEASVKLRQIVSLSASSADERSGGVGAHTPTIQPLFESSNQILFF